MPDLTFWRSTKPAVRVVDSVFEFNGSGVTSAIEGDRSGRGENAVGTIYVRGAQPIIVGNTFRNNADAIINIDVNSLNHHNVVDVGRATGRIGTLDSTQDNQGPLVRENIIDTNGINGMVIRGGDVLTESVWDDADVVHVVFDSVVVPNHHTFGGLRLKSSPTQSLVVKAQGKTAGFLTSGTAIGTPDHIGGALQVLGQPGNPVILTSFYDDTVGAGLDQEGQTQVDTDGLGRPTRTVRAGSEASFQIDLNFGPAIRQFPDLMDAARLAANIWEEQLEDDIVVTIDVDITNTLSPQPVQGFPGAGVLSSISPPLNNFDVGFAFDFNTPTQRTTTTNLFSTTSWMVSTSYGSVRSAMIADAGAHESLLSQLPDSTSLDVLFPQNVAVPFAVDTEMELTSANALALGLSGSNVASQFDPEEVSDGTILITDNLDLFDLDRTDGLKNYREDFQTQFMTQIGEVLGFTSSLEQVEFFLDNPVVPNGTVDQTVDISLSPLDLFRFAPGEGGTNFQGSSRLMDPQIGDHVFYAGGELDFREYPFEGIQVGDIPIGTGYDNQRVSDEINDNFANRWRDDIFFRNGRLVNTDTIGIMDPFSINRDEVLQTNDSVINTQGLIIDISEADRLAFDSIGYDVVGGAPGDWNGIRLEELTYDGNIDYASEAETSANRNDLPATAQSLGALAENRNAGNEELRLGFEVHGMLQSNDDVDLYSFRGVAGTPVWIDIDNTHSALDSVVELVSSAQTVLAGSDNSLLESNGTAAVGGAIPFAGTDLYSTNPLDAGMQVVLPGPVGLQSTYFVQVRSADAGSSGRYELQVRLQATDEVPGTSIRFADIRYATTGIDIIGPPSESPLAGDQVEDESLNDYFSEYSVNPVGDDDDPTNRYTNFGGVAFNKGLPYEVSAQYLGDLSNTRQGAISVFGSLQSDFSGFFGGGDVDWYRFDVRPDDRRDSRMGVTFDIDFADGLGGPDTTLAVYRSDFGVLTSPLTPNITRNFTDLVPELVYYSEGGNIADDQAVIGESSVVTGGSFGSRDPFIGPVTLNDDSGFGFPFFFETGVYFVAVSSIDLIPVEVANARQNNVPLLQPILADPNRGFEVDETVREFGDVPLHVFNPDAPFNAVTTGEYQLEIRVSPLPEDLATPLNGDENRERVQGQLIIANNSITSSRTFGIRVQDDRRDQRNYGGFTADVDFTNDFYANSSSYRREHGQFTTGDWLPNSAPRALPGLNEERVVPGITIANNVIANGIDGGIQLQGDPNGIVLDVFDLDLICQAFPDFDGSELNRREFTLWDHNGAASRRSNSPRTAARIPTRSPSVTIATRRTTPIRRWSINELLARNPSPPTTATFLADEIRHALSLSDLDIQVYKAEANDDTFGITAGDFGSSFLTVENYQTGEDSDEERVYGLPVQLYIEGAAEIGMPDVIFGNGLDIFFPPDTFVPPITAHVSQQSSVTYARIVNNTLVGRGGNLTANGQEVDSHGVRDVGIIIEDNASPTLLNNVIANFATGIRSDLSANDSNADRRTFIGATSAIEQINFEAYTVITSDAPPSARANFGTSYLPFGFDDVPMHHRDVENSETPYLGARPTIVGATIFQGNADDNVGIGRGDFAITLPNSDPLFVDAAAGNYFLAEGSRAIDSSIDFLSERDYLGEVLEAAGIATAAIDAPDVDSIGILRVDDPTIEPPDGLGSNVFKDRGALERADFVGPTASLIDPLDNDPDGIDQDAGVDSVAVLGELLTRFELRFTDGASLADPVFGSGVDDSTVASDAIVLRRNGVALVEDTDYFLTYDQTNNRLRIIPVAGVWTGGTYVVELVRDEDGDGGIRDLANNPIRPNRSDGTTQFVIAVNDGVDFGDAPASYGDASHEFVDGVRLGEFVTVESEANSNSTASGDFGDDGVILPSTTLRGSLLDVTVIASGEGRVSGWVDWNGDGDFNDLGEEILSNALVVAGDNLFSGVSVPSDAIVGNTFARFRYSTQGGLTPTGVAADGEVEDYLLTVEENPWRNPRDANDVDDNGTVAPLDALLVINELNANVVSDPETGALPDTPPANFAPPFVDVNGDGFVSPIDALLVINRLNTPAAALSASAGLGGTEQQDAAEAARGGLGLVRLG